MTLLIMNAIFRSELWRIPRKTSLIRFDKIMIYFDNDKIFCRLYRKEFYFNKLISCEIIDNKICYQLEIKNVPLSSVSKIAQVNTI